MMYRFIKCIFYLTMYIVNSIVNYINVIPFSTIYKRHSKMSIYFMKLLPPSVWPSPSNCRHRAPISSMMSPHAPTRASSFRLLPCSKKHVPFWLLTWCSNKHYSVNMRLDKCCLLSFSISFDLGFLTMAKFDVSLPIRLLMRFLQLPATKYGKGYFQSKPK